jgi:hypothetical protein
VTQKAAEMRASSHEKAVGRKQTKDRFQEQFQERSEEQSHDVGGGAPGEGSADSSFEQEDVIDDDCCNGCGVSDSIGDVSANYYCNVIT